MIRTRTTTAGAVTRTKTAVVAVAAALVVVILNLATKKIVVDPRDVEIELDAVALAAKCRTIARKTIATYASHRGQCRPARVVPLSPKRKTVEIPTVRGGCAKIPDGLAVHAVATELVVIVVIVQIVQSVQIVEIVRIVRIVIDETNHVTNPHPKATDPPDTMTVVVMTLVKMTMRSASCGSGRRSAREKRARLGLISNRNRNSNRKAPGKAQRRRRNRAPQTTRYSTPGWTAAKTSTSKTWKPS